MNQGHTVVRKDSIIAAVLNGNVEQVSELVHKGALFNIISVCMSE